MQMRRKNLERRQERAIEEKSSLLKNIEEAENLKLFPLQHYKDTLVKIEELQIQYDTKSLPPVSLEIRNGDRVVLQGANGCGKSSIIKVLLQHLAGETDILYAGSIETASGLKVSYISQDTSHLHGTLEEYAREQDLDYTLFLALLRKLDFSRGQFEKRMEDYSQGQKKKVLIAGSLCKKAHLYIWDEPLNYIDIFSRIQIENLILEFKPTMLLVEHDKTFVEKIGTTVKKL